MSLRPGRWLLAGGLLILVSVVPAAEVEVVDRVDLEQRVQRLERIVQGQGLSELLLQVEQLQAEMRRLQGKTEGLQHKIDQLKSQQRELYSDLDRRLQQLSQTGESSPPLSTEEVTRDVAAELTTTDPGEKAYQTALEALKEGRYEEAVAALEQFPQQHPDSHYRANAQYWLGEAHYVLRNFKAAAAAFQTLIKQYPKSAKVPDAMFKQGLAYYELAQWEQAKAQLQEVTTRFPASTVSRLAEEHLKKMEREGHI